MTYDKPSDDITSADYRFLIYTYLLYAWTFFTHFSIRVVRRNYRPKKGYHLWIKWWCVTYSSTIRPMTPYWLVQYAVFQVNRLNSHYNQSEANHRDITTLRNAETHSVLTHIHTPMSRNQLGCRIPVRVIIYQCVMPRLFLSSKFRTKYQ